MPTASPGLYATERQKYLQEKGREKRHSDGLSFLAPFLMFPEHAGPKPCKLPSVTAGKGGLTLEMMVEPPLSIFAAIQSKATHQLVSRKHEASARQE